MSRREYDEDYQDRYDDDDFQEEIDRREYRRSRARKNRIIVVIVSILIVALIAFGVFFGIKTILDSAAFSKNASEVEEQLDGTDSEEQIVIEAPEE